MQRERQGVTAIWCRPKAGLGVEGVRSSVTNQGNSAQCVQDIRRRHDLRLWDQGLGPLTSDFGSDGARSVDSIDHSDAGRS